jgi:hypothetical protein
MKEEFYYKLLLYEKSQGARQKLHKLNTNRRHTNKQIQLTDQGV